MSSRLILMLYPAPFRELRLHFEEEEGQLEEEGRPLETQIHKIRDGLAMLHLACACESAGYRSGPGQTVLNLPQAARDLLRKTGRLDENAAVSPEASDLVLLTTRPPTDDHGAFELDGAEGKDELRDDKRWIPRSGLKLEREIFTGLRQFLEVCTRSCIAIAGSVKLPDNAAVFRHLVFYSNKGGRIQYARSEGDVRPQHFHDDPTLTMGYLVVLPRVSEAGYRVLAMWGPGGAESLAVAQLLVGLFRGTLDRALMVTTPSLWLIPFLSPGHVPFPRLCFSESELEPTSPAPWSPLGPFA